MMANDAQHLAVLRQERGAIPDPVAVRYRQRVNPQWRREPGESWSGARPLSAAAGDGAVAGRAGPAAQAGPPESDAECSDGRSRSSSSS